MTFDDNELRASIRLTLRGGIRSPGNLTLDAWSSGPGAPPRNGTAGGCEAPERRHMRGRAPAFVSFQSSLSHFFFFLSFYLLGPHPQPMEVLRLGVLSEL